MLTFLFYVLLLHIDKQKRRYVMEHEFYTIKEVAEKLRMKVSWVDKKARDGKINVVRMGTKNRLVKREEMERLLKDGVE